MNHYCVDSQKFLVGAALGGVLGSVAALLVAPQSGKELRQDICNVYGKTENLAKKMGCQTCDWASKAKTVVEEASNTVKKWVSDDEKEATKDPQDSQVNLLVGGAAGLVLGAVVALLLAPKSGKSLRDDLVNVYEEVSSKSQVIGNSVGKKGKAFAKTASDTGNKWLNVASQLLDGIAEGNQNAGEGLIEKAKDLINNKCARDAIDLASAGLRLWRDATSKT